MNILFINLPYHGHVVPTIGLVQQLVKRGCDVTYLMPFGWENMISESGAEFIGYQNHRQLAEQMKNACAAAEEIIERFDLVIYEQFFFLGKHLAEKYQKPAVRVFTAPATNKKLMAAFISGKGPMSLFRIGWINRGFTRDVAGSLPLKTNNWLDEIVENPPELNLVYTLREYQPYQQEFPETRFCFVGPSIYERKQEPFGFQKGSRPVVYVSLGTIMKGATSFFRNCIEAFRDEDVDVIISVGRKFDLRKLRNVPPNVHLYPYVPQVQILKMSDVFITHGGMNSVSEAMVTGTPMVVIPLVSDQPVNADCVERLGIGKRLDYAQADAVTIKNTVQSVMDDEKIRDSISNVKHLIQESQGNSGAAERIIAYYHDKKGHP